MKPLGLIVAVIIGGCILLTIFMGAIGAIAAANAPRPSTPVVAPVAEPVRDPGPVKPLNVRLSNSYADSIFTLDVTVLGKPVDGGNAPMGKKVRVWDRERIAGHDFVRRDALFTVPRAADIKVNLTAMSLGENRYLTTTIKGDPYSDTLSIDYTWDVATAAFTISYGWR